MILKKNQNTITINENVGQIYRVTLVLGLYHKFLTLVNPTTPFIDDNKKSRPEFFKESYGEDETELIFQSRADKDYEILIRYFPPLKEV